MPPTPLLPDPLPFLDTHGLVPGGGPIGFVPYHDMITAATDAGGRRYADFLMAACEQQGVRYRIRHASRSAFERHWEKAQALWVIEDRERVDDQAAEAANVRNLNLAMGASAEDAEEAAQNAVEDQQAAYGMAVLIEDAGTGWRLRDPASGAVVGTTETLPGPDGTPLAVGVRQPVLLTRSILLADGQYHTADVHAGFCSVELDATGALQFRAEDDTPLAPATPVRPGRDFDYAPTSLVERVARGKAKKAARKGAHR